MNGTPSAVMTLTLPRVVSVTVTDDTVSVDLEDGRTIAVPIGWYLRLAHGTPAERANVQISGAGYGMHWPEFDDDIVIHKAFTEHWILLTNDKDFGEKVYRERYGHRGVVLLRLTDERAVNKIETLRHVLATYAEQLADRFVVATETRVRFARSSQ